MPVWLTSLFVNPWMLLWIPVAAAPVVIHLWYRQKYREIPWAAMEYLLAAIEKSWRLMRIEQWLLLLVRIVLLLLLVLATAETLLRNRIVNRPPCQKQRIRCAASGFKSELCRPNLRFGPCIF